MQDPLDVYHEVTNCPFCHTKFSGVVRLIPDCGDFICGSCFDELKSSLDGSDKYKCQACGDHHTLPENGLPECKKMLQLARHPIEKPLSEQAKKLKLLVKSVQDEKAKLEAFDPRDYVEQYCLQLELEIREAAESAVKHINVTESGLLKKVRAYRQQCLSAHVGESTKMNGLTEEIQQFATKWGDYFKRLNALASDNEVEAAISQTDDFQARMKKLDQEKGNKALNGKLINFQRSEAFFMAKDLLGKLVDTSPLRAGQQLTQRNPLKLLTGHSEKVSQVLFLPDGRLASCSWDKSIKVWDVSTGQELFSLNSNAIINSIVVSANGWLFGGLYNATIQVWDLKARKELRSLRGHTKSVGWLKDLKNGYFVSYSIDDTIKVWSQFRIVNYFPRVSFGNENRESVGFGVLSDDNVVTCFRDNQHQQESTLRVWHPFSGQLVKSVPTGLTGVVSLLALSNGQIAIGTCSGTIKIVDLTDESRTRIREKAHEKSASCLVQMLSNGANLVSSGVDATDSSSSVSIFTIKIWNLADLSLLQEIRTSHLESITSMSIAQDETILAAGSEDRTISLWKVQAGLLV